jgi:glycosyltransferase involved in cell wall biosynthesis
MSRRPRVLLVSYLFPPAGGIAVQRMLAMARYLPENGIDVQVLCASNPSVPTMDASLVSRIPANVQVTRTWSPEIPYSIRQGLWRRLAALRHAKPAAASKSASPQPSRPSSSALKNIVRRILSPDPEVLWVPGALRAARRTVARDGIDIVLVSAPPFSSLLIGNRLKRDFPILKLVSDFRDEWLDFYLNAFEYFRSDSIRRHATRIEAETVHNSDLVLSITNSCVNTIRSRYPSLPDDRFLCLPNGFDPAMFADFQPKPHGEQVLRVAHVGTVYPTATPRFYLDALDALDDRTRARISTHFVGRVTDEERGSMLKRKSHIVEHGFVPQSQAVEAMAEADVLLLTMTDPSFTSGKIYDYLATGKPILAISPRGGEVDDVLRETGAGWLADPSQPGSIRDALLEILALRDSGVLASRSRPEHVARYARPSLVASFATRLQALLEAK